LGLRNLARELDLEGKITFLGGIPREKTLAKLADSDVLVHPSLHDSGGWVCIEAMACGRPVICLDLGGPSLQVTAETGCKVAAKDPDQAVRDMSAAMLRLALEPALRLAMGAAGRRRVKEYFALENIGPTVARMYQEVQEEHCAHRTSGWRTMRP
jgi:glycosyltransferase involved in cell wall biosynthesis